MLKQDQDAAACRRLVETVYTDLRIHTTLEEEVFYPAVREAIGDDDLMNEAAVEHETAKMLIDQLENMEADDRNYFATFTVLGEYVKHHIKEGAGKSLPGRRHETGFALSGGERRARVGKRQNQRKGAAFARNARQPELPAEKPRQLAADR